MTWVSIYLNYILLRLFDYNIEADNIEQINLESKD